MAALEKLTSSVAENVQTTTAADDTSTTVAEISNILDHTQSVSLSALIRILQQHHRHYHGIIVVVVNNHLTTWRHIKQYQ